MKEKAIIKELIKMGVPAHIQAQVIKETVHVVKNHSVDRAAKTFTDEQMNKLERLKAWKVASDEGLAELLK